MITGALTTLYTSTPKEAFTLSHGSMLINAVPTQTCVLGSSYYNDGTTVEISYDPTAKTIVYNVNVTLGTYVAVGYGDSMTDTDMCFWNGNGASSI